MDKPYFNELKSQIKSDIEKNKPSNSFELYGQEIRKVALGHEYDKEMITSLLDGVIEAGANLDMRSVDWVKQKNNNIHQGLGRNNFDRFLQEYLTFENEYRTESDKILAQLDEKKLEAMFDILSVLHGKLFWLAQEVLAMFLIDMVFPISKYREDSDRHSFMGGYSLISVENTYLCFYQTLEFFEKNNVQITPDIERQIKSLLSEYLLECWCRDFNEKDGVPEDKARLGEAMCLLYLKKILKNDVAEITKFKKSLQQYASERYSATIAIELVSAFIDKKILEGEIGKKDKLEPGKKFKI